MIKDKIAFKDCGRLMVVAEDLSSVPYMYIYDDKQVYLSSDGEIHCLFCISQVKMLWKRADRGECWCESCNKERGTFRQVGYGVRVVPT